LKFHLYNAFHLIYHQLHLCMVNFIYHEVTCVEIVIHGKYISFELKIDENNTFIDVDTFHLSFRNCTFMVNSIQVGILDYWCYLINAIEFHLINTFVFPFPFHFYHFPSSFPNFLSFVISLTIPKWPIL